MHSTHRARAPRAVRALAAFALLSLATRAQAACTGPGSAAAYAAGASPRMVIRADFDRDGIDDLAIANGTGAALTVLRGNGANGIGNGTFSAAVAYASGTTGMGLAAADFDGDGASDLAVAVSTGVVLWRNTGNGTFTGGSIVAAGANARGVGVGDFDRDGDDDLAIASSSTNALVILRNDGTGAFSTAGTIVVGGAPTRVACADFDDDGRLDLACSNNSSANVSVLRGDGAGGFAVATTVAAPGSPWGLTVLDADSDGRPDLLVSNGGGSTITLLRNAGGLAFTNAGTSTTPLAPRDLAVADFDGDGLADVAAACAGTNQVTVLRGTGATFVPWTNVATGTGAAGLVAGDFDRDGAADLACANTSANTVTRLLGTCPTSAASAPQLLAPNGGEAWWPGTEQVVRWSRPSGVAAVDLELSRDDGATWTPLVRGATGDHARVLAVGVASERMRLRVRDAAIAWRRDGSDGAFSLCGLFRAPLTSRVGFAATRVAIGDLDGDGHDDALVAGNGLATVLRGEAGGRFTAGAPFACDAAAALRLADADGDGRLDLVALGSTELAWRSGDGAGGFGPGGVVNVAHGVDVACGDFDSDGIADAAVLVDDGSARTLVVRTATGGVPFAAGWSTALDGAPHTVVPADFDGDGITDLAVSTGDALEIWRGGGIAGRGDARFSLASSRALPGGAGDLALGDFDRDGRLDLAACALASGDLFTVGTSTAAPAEARLGTPVASPTGLAAASPVVADFDGDGRADVALVAAGAVEVRVLAGGAAGFGPPRAFAGGTGALAAGDFDGDGATDLLVARPDSGDVACLRSMCPPLVPGAIALAARHDGERWTTGFARRVAWTRSANVAVARVELSRDDGAHWTAIAATTVDSALAWIVSGPATTSARLRVADAACPSRFDESGRFVIAEPFASAEAATEPVPAGATALALSERDAAVVAAGRVYVAPLAGGAWEDAGLTGSRAAKLADVDGDGRDDLVTLLANFVSVRRALPEGGFGAARQFATAGANVALVARDFDLDGRADLAVACGSAPAQRVLAFRSLGATADGLAGFAAPVSLALPAVATAMIAADANADGITDLLVAHAGGLATLLGNGGAGSGDGSFRLGSTRAFGSGPLSALVCADLDADGAVDVAALDSTGVIAAAGTGAGAFRSPVTLAAPAGARDLAWGDFDADGLADLLVGTDDRALLLRGTGRVAADGFSAAGTPASRARAIAVRDHDGDGVPDLLALDDAAALLRVARGARERAAEPVLESPATAHLALDDTLTLHWAGIAAADLDVTFDGGDRWIALARAVQGGTWRWTVHGVPTGLARVRVRDAWAGVRGDTTAAFAIAPVTLGAGGTAAPAFAFASPWPNPSPGPVTLAFALARDGDAALDVRDVAGRHVRALHRGPLAAGRHAFAWDGRDDGGSALPAGRYFVTLRSGAARATRTVVLVR